MELSNKRHTQVIASLGAASDSPEIVEKLILTGVDIFRLNFARDAHEIHQKRIETIRSVSQKLEDTGQIKNPVRIMTDLQGPRLRTGQLVEANLSAGDRVKLTTDDTSDMPGVISTTYPDLVRSLAPGNTVLLHKGRIVLNVLQSASESEDGLVQCEVVQGGELTSFTEVNAPDAPLKTPALTEKDQADLKFALDAGVDLIALSYPQDANDVLETRQFMAEHGRVIPIVAKIERPLSLQNLDAISDAAEGVMVASGDLGIETGMVNLPKNQTRIIQSALKHGKMAVVANQLLDSMTHNTRPTRSDVFDVARSLQEGANVLMFTTEVSDGKYPVEAMTMAMDLIDQYEVDPKDRKAPTPTDAKPTVFQRVVTFFKRLLPKQLIQRVTQFFHRLFSPDWLSKLDGGKAN